MKTGSGFPGSRNCGTVHLIYWTRVPVTFLFTLLKTISTDGDKSLKVLLAVQVFSTYRVCPQKLTYLYSEPVSKTRN